MIITAGKYKGRKIKTVKSGEVRPTSSKIRESIFNIIQSSITGAVMLDLFAGSGMMGFEALSRGASKVVFVEKSPQVIRLLKENISLFDADIKLIPGDSKVALDRLKGHFFDIIFIDPPYALNLVEPSLEKIKENNLLAEDGLIIIEHSPSTNMSEIINRLNYTIIKAKRYGDTSITIIG